MIKYIIIYFSLFTLAIGSWQTTFAQTEIVRDYEIVSKLVKITLSEFEVIDANLMSQLDSFLISEQICSYYSDTLKIKISICDYNNNLKYPCKDSDTMSVSISTMNWIKVGFHNAVGFFYYKEHLIIISSVATKRFFSPMGSIKLFSYYENYRKNKNGSEIQIPTIDDDSQTSWHFKFVNGTFNVEEFGLMPNCPSKRIK